MIPRLHPRDAGLKFARTLKSKARVKRDPTPEAVIQDLTEQYLRRLGVAYFRIPNAAYRAIFAGNASIGTKREAAEYLRGFPDLLILSEGRFLGLELKRDGGKLRASQRIWRDSIGTKVAESFEAARVAIDEFLKIGG